MATINCWADDVAAAQRWYTELLGVPAYFERPGPDGRVAYAEFRIGDNQTELGSSTVPSRRPALPPRQAG